MRYLLVLGCILAVLFVVPAALYLSHHILVATDMAVWGDFVVLAAIGSTTLSILILLATEAGTQVAYIQALNAARYNRRIHDMRSRWERLLP